MLDEGLAAAGIDRADTYVTNVVKHFKWTRSGKRRLHKKPSAREIAACLPWLEKEIELIEPEVLVCLGATAAQALLGRDFKVTRQRGKILPTPLAKHAVATIHPSSILRQETAADQRRERERFIEDSLSAIARLPRSLMPRTASSAPSTIRSAATTIALSAASSRQIAAPKPPPPPVTRRSRNCLCIKECCCTVMHSFRVRAAGLIKWVPDY